MLPGRTYTPAVILWILRKRLWLLAASIVVATLVAVRMAVTLPDVYRSQVTILVVPPRVAPNVFQPALADTLENRLLAITPEILNPVQLERIITELDLYPELRKTASPSQVIEAMRASITGPRVVRADAFSIAYHGFRPEKVMQVTQRLSDLFIAENVKNRAQVAADTSEFLDSQLEETRSRLVRQERELQEYRTLHAASLPSQLAANLQVLRAAQEELRGLRDVLRRDRERRAGFEQTLLELEQAPAATAPDLATDEPEAESELDLAVEPASEPPAAPDAVSAKAEPDQPEVPASANPDLNFGVPGTPTAVRLQNARRHLQALHLRLTPAHPDVVRAQRIIAQLEKAAIDQSARAVARVSTGPTGTARAAGIALTRRRIAAVEQEITGRVEEEMRLRQVVAEYQHRVDNGPAHESRLIELSRDYEIIRESYRALLSKKEETGFAANLERQHAGQQFRVIESARLPARPAYPNRPQIVLMGTMIGLGFGLALAVLLEVRDRSFRAAPEVVHVLSLPVLAMVPAISTRYERRVFIRRLALGAGLVALIVLVGGGVFVLRGWW